jgi:hypothetical protein
MSPVVLLGVLACSSLPEGPTGLEPVTVSMWIDGQVTSGGGALVVQTSFDRDGELSPPVPTAQNLTFEPDGPPVVEQVASHQVVRQRYVFRGKQGSHEIPPLIATWTGPDGQEEQAETAPVWVDMGVDAPDVGELVDIVEPPTVWTIPWVPLAAVAGTGLLFVGGVAFAFTRPRREREVVVVPEAPDIVAIRAWEAVRSDEAMAPEEKAEALSRIFREYVESVLAFEATAWTTTEILGRLAGMGHLPEGNVPRAKRLLRATDRVKFAEATPESELFDDLDADLRAFVGTTRPTAWRGEGQP